MVDDSGPRFTNTHARDAKKISGGLQRIRHEQRGRSRTCRRGNEGKVSFSLFLSLTMTSVTFHIAYVTDNNTGIRGNNNKHTTRRDAYFHREEKNPEHDPRRPMA